MRMLWNMCAKINTSMHMFVRARARCTRMSVHACVCTRIFMSANKQKIRCLTIFN